MGINTILLFITFSLLIILGLLNEERRQAAFSRSQNEWTVDIMGLLIQGVLIPAFPFIMVPILISFFPDHKGIFDVHPILGFSLSFLLVDYLYYWNHRLFHRRSYWPIHRLHHSSRQLDIFATSRNSVVTSFLFIYVWSQILGMFFLKDSTPYMLGLGLTFALDLWRHSGMKQPQWMHFTLGKILILPEQHVLHHSLTGRTKNYGANFCWWDQLHGTYSQTLIENKNLENIKGKNIWRELFIPWKVER